VGSRRVLGFAEYGDPEGRLVLWHHGTPGARRQIPLAGRRAAERLGVRLVCVERPGVGDSTDHRYRSFRDWADDVAVVVEDLGHDEFAVVGLSGGGPYALACAHELPDRVTSVGLLGTVCPMAGPDAAPVPPWSPSPHAWRTSSTLCAHHSGAPYGWPYSPSCPLRTRSTRCTRVACLRVTAWSSTIPR
jgi:pimeloyl-ACP methyl ester carboxylesterase